MGDVQYLYFRSDLLDDPVAGAHEIISMAEVT
jgi:hypothetical protein